MPNSRLITLDDRWNPIAVHRVPHRIRAGMIAHRRYWLCDGHDIYEYTRDMSLVSKEPYRYPGGSCAGLAFDGITVWTIDLVQGRLLQHLLK